MNREQVQRFYDTLATERLNRIIKRGLRKYLKCTKTQIFLQDLINS